ncbi:MAG TPA: class I tRNA ligase family protein, partial [Dehalococcoidia bacterium]|nr:class I tRNA ligase family protein [Dehalococcoidia bacterium]
MFRPVDSKVSFPQMEERVLQLWKQRDVFRKSIEQREGAPQFILYEGPPTANGTPGIHHVLARVFKDIIPRYKTMQGFQAHRKGGWDTHGLPVELEIERELGLASKRDIEEYGIERFNQKCRESVFRYVQDWEAVTERIGFWIDMDHAYSTYTNDYIESGWWIIKQLWDKGLVYLGYKTTPHCPRCGTSLSSHEVALGYDENTVDPSIYVKFKLAPPSAVLAREPESMGLLHTVLFEEDVPSYVLAWTTTPWTLPGNIALAVALEASYVVVERTEGPPSTSLPTGQAGSGRAGKERLVLAQALVEQALKGDEYRVVASVQGSDLVGLRYEPLYSPPEFGFPMMRFPREDEADGGAELLPYEHPQGEPLTYPVIGGEFVSMEDGTGVVHIAPAFGEEDFEIGKEEGLFFVQHVDLKGQMAPCPLPFGGKFVKDADPLVIQELQGRGLMYRSGTITHTYPFCWRCDTPLLYYVKTSWYIRTTALKQQLID